MTMMAAVAEDDILATGRECAESPDVLLEECSAAAAAAERDDHKLRQLFCEPGKTNSNVRATFHTVTDVEDSFQTDGNINDNSYDVFKGSSSYLDLFSTVYIPFILLWFRRSMLGPANLFRSIVVGQLMRIVFVDDISEWISQKLHPWLELILSQSYAAGITTKGSSTGPVSTLLGAGSGKTDPHAWPPPAFTALAMLTIFALVVHPDGLTWILLGKIRDFISDMFSILGRCLEFFVNDYGVFPTIIASATLAAMLFIVFVVLRTLSPKKKTKSNHNNNPVNKERKKKKKKGGNARYRRDHNHHHRSNRIKSLSKPQSQSAEEMEAASTEAMPCSPMPSQPPSDISGNTSKMPSSLSKDVSDSSLDVPSLSASPPTKTTEKNSTEQIKKVVANDDLPTSHGATNKLKEYRTRRRMMSNSTLDTTPLSDDQSCGSTSVMSFPSVSVNSNRSGNLSRKSNKGSGSSPRRVKHQGIVKSPKNVEKRSGKKKKGVPMESSLSSRWDALKPEISGKDKTNNYQHANGNTNNKKHSQQQQEQQRHHRGNGRRGPGTNGNGPSRKGRKNQKSANTEKPTVDRKPIMTMPGSCSVSSTSAKNVRIKTKGLSLVTSNRKENNCSTWSTNSDKYPVLNSCTNSPPSINMPPPPPGFQNSPLMSRFEKGNVDQHQHKQQQHHANNDLTVPTLFETPIVVRPLSEQHRNNFSRIGIPVAPPQQQTVGISPKFFPPASNVSSSNGFFSENTIGDTRIHENPFSRSNNHNSMSRHQANLDSQIEADMQELGGQMAGSILDF